jgi:D-erythronate 2-dehydrogenase
MTLIITGASGFVGSELAARIVSDDTSFSKYGKLVLIDRHWYSRPHGRVDYVEADLSDPGTTDSIARMDPSAIVHLASMPAGSAEADFDGGWQANVEASLALLRRLRAQHRLVRFVFASSIGVFGSPIGDGPITDETYPRPTMSYGAQKLLLEIVISDMSRRGCLDGVSLRLPGIVARPPQPTGHISAFMSTIFHALRERKAFDCPIDRTGTCWFMSVHTCVENIVHALGLPSQSLVQARAFNLPALRLTIPELVDAIGSHLGDDVSRLVNYSPMPAVQAQFGSYPPLTAALAQSLGFIHDGSAAHLVANVFSSRSNVGANA